VAVPALVSLPIPDKRSPVLYEDIEVGGHTLGRIVADLTHGKQKPHFGAHLDPDLLPNAYPRQEGWRPLLGQAGSAQTRLERDGVGVGDLFLFFGWFRRVECAAGVFRFVKGAPDLHLLWGWLQVGAVLSVGMQPTPPWAAYHPHVASADHRAKNTLYIAGDRLRLDGDASAVPAAGVFQEYADRLRLTRTGAGRSTWDLPSCFAPVPGQSQLGYHADPSRWTVAGDRVYLQTTARGQEFALDASSCPGSLDWVRNLFG